MKTKNHKSFFRSWHRGLGLASCLFLLVLSLTGVLINHAHHMGLDEPGVQVNWILDYYGIGQPSRVSSFALLPSPLIGIDKQLWLDDKLILESSYPVIAAIWHQKQIVAIDVKQLYIFDHLGQLLETQNSSNGLSPPLSNLFVSSDNEVLLATQHGLLLTDQQLLDWRSADPTLLDRPSPPLPKFQPVELSPKQITLSRSMHLSWERVILDLHSGRVFGAWAIWLWDLVALAILLLTLSGLWMWQQKKYRR